jgi:5-methyltetrahydropteroyltriglutamate--homocysteine methyltransferase
MPRIAPTGRPPFRADHIGSLLRPAALRQAFKRHAEKALADAEFARIQDEAIRAVVKLRRTAACRW